MRYTILRWFDRIKKDNTLTSLSKETFHGSSYEALADLVGSLAKQMKGNVIRDSLWMWQYVRVTEGKGNPRLIELYPLVSTCEDAKYELSRGIAYFHMKCTEMVDDKAVKLENEIKRYRLEGDLVWDKVIDVFGRFSKDVSELEPHLKKYEYHCAVAFIDE